MPGYKPRYAVFIVAYCSFMHKTLLPTAHMTICRSEKHILPEKLGLRSHLGLKLTGGWLETLVTSGNPKGVHPFSLWNPSKWLDIQGFRRTPMKAHVVLLPFLKAQVVDSSKRCFDVQKCFPKLPSCGSHLTCRTGSFWQVKGICERKAGFFTKMF